MSNITKKIPSSLEIASAISFELGKAGGPSIFRNYPMNYNKALPKVGAGIRRWLVRELSK